MLPAPFPAPPGADVPPSFWERWGDWAVSLVAVAAIWPFLLDWPHWGWRLLGWASVLALAALLIRKCLRLRKEEPEETQLPSGGARRPGGTPGGRKLSKDSGGV